MIVLGQATLLCFTSSFSCLVLLVCLQFGSVGPMAITLCQSLGQNIGMLRNKERPAAGNTTVHCKHCEDLA